MTRRRSVTILGSTGSIGTQALEVIAAHPDRFTVSALAAGGSNIGLLAEQVRAFGVSVVAVAREDTAEQLRAMLATRSDKDLEESARGAHTGDSHTDSGVRMPEIVAGPNAATEIAARPTDVVLNGITGSIGLAPTLAALKAGHTLALANKESLVAGGPLVRKIAQPGQIVPVDSEHSAIAQALRSGRREEVQRLILTASGGPFRGRNMADLAGVTPAQALAHPTWDMGAHVTINSATLMNKALEVIEAHELFDVPYEDIDVVVHPQSVVHSMVEFRDGSTIAQASMPDMRLPIGLGLTWPERLETDSHTPSFIPRWEGSQTWEFLPLEGSFVRVISLAKEVGRAGGVFPAVFNAANEECIAAFLAERLSFPGIVDTVRTVTNIAFDSSDLRDALADKDGKPGSVEDIVAAERWARLCAQKTMEDLTP